MTTLATQVRQIIRSNELAFGGFWTNKYENCRTVKCYLRNDDWKDYKVGGESRVRRTVDDLYKWAGEKGIVIDVKMIDWGDKLFGVYHPSFIVRIPFEK